MIPDDKLEFLEKERDVMRFLVLLAIAMMSGCAGPRTGILVMAHGGSEAWNREVEATVAPLRADYEVEIAYGMARASTIGQAVERLEKKGVRRTAVVRMFISGDSFLKPTEQILGLRDIPEKKMQAGSHMGSHMGGGGGHHMEPVRRIASQGSFMLSKEGVGDSPLVDEILLDRVKALSSDPTKESVLILAHGPGDEAENERWLADMRLRVQGLHKLGKFRHIQCETLREDWPERRINAERRIRAYVEAGNRSGGRVIVVPFRVSGFGPYKELLDGLTYTSDGRGFCPHPKMTQWIKQTADELLATR